MSENLNEIICRAFCDRWLEGKVIGSFGESGLFFLDVADSEEQRRRGFQRTSSIPPGSGLLFPLPSPRETSFWMKNTCLPLDIIFINPKGVVSDVHRQCPPDSDDHYFPSEPASLVVEVAGGQASRVSEGQSFSVRPIPGDQPERMLTLVDHWPF